MGNLMTGLPWLPHPASSLASAELGVPKMLGQGGHRWGEWGICALLKAALCRARAAGPRLPAGLSARAALGRERLAPWILSVFLFFYVWPLGNIMLPLVAGVLSEPQARGLRRRGGDMGRAGCAAALALRALPASVRCAALSRPPPRSSSQP